MCGRNTNSGHFISIFSWLRWRCVWRSSSTFESTWYRPYWSWSRWKRRSKNRPELAKKLDITNWDRYYSARTTWLFTNRFVEFTWWRRSAILWRSCAPLSICTSSRTSTPYGWIECELAALGPNVRASGSAAAGWSASGKGFPAWWPDCAGTFAARVHEV